MKGQITMEDTISNRDALERIKELADSYGNLYEKYSGRGMFGAHCVGIVTDNPSAVIGAAMRSGIEGHRRDSMGRDAIVYWPDIQMTEAAPTPDPVEPTPADLAQEYLTDYLRGYGRDNPERLRAIASRNKWAAHAAAVLDQRQYKLLDALEDNVLLQIEAGNIDVREIAASVANEMDAAKGEGTSHG